MKRVNCHNSTTDLFGNRKMKSFKLALILFCTTLLLGCKIGGDVIINKTSGPVKVTLVTADGVEQNRLLQVNGMFALSAGKPDDLAHQLVSVRACDAFGSQIGQLSISRISKTPKWYGKHAIIIVFSDGIFRAPQISAERLVSISEEELKKMCVQ